MLDRGWFTRHRRMGERGNNSSGRSKNECVKRTCRSGNVALLSVEHPAASSAGSRNAGSTSSHDRTTLASMRSARCCGVIASISAAVTILRGLLMSERYGFTMVPYRTPRPGPSTRAASEMHQSAVIPVLPALTEAVDIITLSRRPTGGEHESGGSVRRRSFCRLSTAEHRGVRRGRQRSRAGGGPVFGNELGSGGPKFDPVIIAFEIGDPRCNRFRGGVIFGIDYIDRGIVPEVVSATCHQLIIPLVHASSDQF